MSEPFRKLPLWPGFGLIALTCLALVGIELYDNFGNGPEWAYNRALVGHTFEVMSTAQSLELAMQDAERGQRGYIITGDESFLEPYRTGSQSAPHLLAKLQQLVADNPDQLQRLAALQKQIDIKLDE